jgi:hypothetical protein
MTKQIAPLTERQAWKALEAHHKNIREVHLRKLFADDPKRGERMTAEAVGLYLDYSKNRVTDETLQLLLQLAEESALRERIDAMFGAKKSTSRKTAPSCTSPYARRKEHPSLLMVRIRCRRSTPCSTRWLISPTVCAAAVGKVIPVNPFAMSSISASAAPTSGR